MVEVITDESSVRIVPPSSTTKMSLNVAGELANIARRLAFHHRMSESSITEVALRCLFEDRTDEEIVEILRAKGANLRRSAVRA